MDNSYQFQNGTDSIDIALHKLVFWKQIKHTPSLTYTSNIDQQRRMVEFEGDNSFMKKSFDVKMGIDQLKLWLDDIELPRAGNYFNQVHRNNQEKKRTATNSVESKSASKSDGPKGERKWTTGKYEVDEWEISNPLAYAQNGVDYSRSKPLSEEMAEADNVLPKAEIEEPHDSVESRSTMEDTKTVVKDIELEPTNAGDYLEMKRNPATGMLYPDEWEIPNPLEFVDNGVDCSH